MSIAAWVFVGLLMGCIASMAAVGGDRRALMNNLALGLFGALVAGGGFYLVAQVEVIDLDPWSVLFSAAGAVVVLVAAHYWTAREQGELRT